MQKGCKLYSKRVQLNFTKMFENDEKFLKAKSAISLTYNQFLRDDKHWLSRLRDKVTSHMWRFPIKEFRKPIHLTEKGRKKKQKSQLANMAW